MPKIGCIFLTLLLFLPCVAASQTTIEWWQFWTNPDIKPTITAIVDEFEAQNPEIQVNVTDLTWANGHEKIVLAFASNAGPDVVELGSDWIAQFAANGQLADLTDSVTGDIPLSDGWSLGTFQDRTYAVPWILGTRVLYFNKSLLRRAGYSANFRPISWPELEDAMVDIHKVGPDIYGWGSNTAEKHRLYKKYLPFFWSAGGHILSDNNDFCVISSVQAIDALKFYKRLHDKYGYLANQRGIEDAFLDGKIGYVLSGDWLLKRIQSEKPTMEFGVTIVPGALRRDGTYPGRSFLGGEFLAVNEQSTKKQAALKFIRFLTSAENQIAFCKANGSANPSSREAQKDSYFKDDEHLSVFITQINAAIHPPVDPDWVLMETEIEAAVEEVLFNGAEPGDALYRARNRIEENWTR